MPDVLTWPTTCRVAAARPTVKTTVRAAVALLVSVLLLVLGATTASAHDRLVSTSPDDGGTVATAPSEIVLTFSDDVVPVGTEIAVQGPDGDAQQGRPRIEGNTVTQALAPGSPKGTYTVTWRATSKDGHPVSGVFRFTAAAAGEPVPSGSTAGNTPTATSATSAPNATTAVGSAATPSATSTGESPQTGTSWALWVVLAVLVLAAAGAVAARARRGHAGGHHG